MRIQWDSTDGADSAEAVKPAAARGSTPFRAALRQAEQWTDLGSQREALRLSAEVGSRNFTLVAPVAHYPGRGDMPLDLDLVYNSRVWQRLGRPGIHRMVFDIDDDWPAPGWSLHLGQLVSLGVGSAMVVEPDGTRRPFTNDGQQDVGNELHVTAHTTDGSDIRYQARWRFSGPMRTLPFLVSGWLVRTNGTKVGFDFGSRTKANATRLTDCNGNMMTVEYDAQSTRMTKITDTCGRVIKLEYLELPNGEMQLTRVTGPAPNQDWGTAQIDTDLLVLNLGRKPLATSFLHPVHEQPAFSPIITGLYYPATQTGYWLPPESYSSYGMLKQVQRCRGMSLANAGGPAVIAAGSVSSQRDYNYPDAPGPGQNDVPTYTTLTEIWDGLDGPPLVTRLSVARTNTGTRSEVTWPDNAKTVQEVDAAGLLKELIVIDPGGRELQRTHVHSWTVGAEGAPRMEDVHVIDDAGHLAKTTFAYGEHSTEPILVDQWEYGLTPLVTPNRVLRRVQTQYVTDLDYLQRNLRNLPEWVRVFEPFDPFTPDIPKVASWTEYLYDQTARGPAPEITGFDEQFDPASPRYVPATAWRGNMTTSLRYANADAHLDPVIETRSYDIAGNLLTSDVGPGRVAYEYGSASRFLAPETTWLTGSAPNSPLMALSRVANWTYGGQPTHLTDANGQATLHGYDPAGRLTSTTSVATGSRIRVFHDDANMTKATTTTPGGAGDVANVTTTFDGRGQMATVRSQQPDNDVTTAYQYDFRDRLRAVSTPHRDGDLPSWASVELDQLDRPLSRLDFDGDITRWHYNEVAQPANKVLDFRDVVFPTVRVVGADGTEQWMSVDGLQRLKQVIFPAPDGPGTVIPTGALNTSYSYDALGNVTGIDLHAAGMPVQQRRFHYDSLGRLVRQLLPERGAGIVEDVGGVVEHWSDRFSYDSRSNLVGREDSRGVQVRFDFNDPLNRLQNVQFSTAGFHDLDHPVVACPDVSYTYATTGDLRRVVQERCAGVSTQDYEYDPVFGLTSVTVTLDAAPHQPFTLGYGYDPLGRRTSTTLPAQYGDGAGNQRPVLDLRYRFGGLPDKLSVAGFADLAHDFAYTAAGQISSMLVGPDGVQETYAHDRRNPLLTTGQRVLHGGVALLDIGYTYDPSSAAENLARRLKVTEDLLEPNGSRHADYDRLGRLSDYSGGPGPVGGWGESYRYDLHGNRGSVTPRGELTAGVPAPPDGEEVLTYDEANRITSAGFAHDAAGNVVSARVDGVDFRYQYDSAGRLCWVQNSATGETTGYLFGACRRRRATLRSKSTVWPPASAPAELPADQVASATFCIWDADRVVATYQATGPDLDATLTWKELSLYLGQRLISTWTNAGNQVSRVRYIHPGLTGTRYVTGPGLLASPPSKPPTNPCPSAALSCMTATSPGRSRATSATLPRASTTPSTASTTPHSAGSCSPTR